MRCAVLHGGMLYTVDVCTEAGAVDIAAVGTSLHQRRRSRQTLRRKSTQLVQSIQPNPTSYDTIRYDTRC